MELNSTEEIKVEDMPQIQIKRRVTAMETILSKDQLDETQPGYQKPKPVEERTSQPIISNKPKEGGEKKKHQKKLYNTDTNEKQGENQPEQDKRRDKDNNGKHEQERDNNRNKNVRQYQERDPQRGA
jgi:hypothetical protein